MNSKKRNPPSPSADPLVLTSFNARVFISQNELIDQARNFYSDKNSDSLFAGLANKFFGKNLLNNDQYITTVVKTMGQGELERVSLELNKDIANRVHSRLSDLLQRGEITKIQFKQRKTYFETIENDAFRVDGRISNGSIKFEDGKIIIDLKPLTFILFTLFGTYEFIANYNDFYDGLDSIRTDINRAIYDLARSDFGRYFAELEFDHREKEDVIERIHLYLRDRREFMTKFGLDEDGEILSMAQIRK